MSLIWSHVCVAAFVLLWPSLLEVATIFQQCVCVENHWARMAPEETTTPTGAPAKEATENKLAFSAAAAAAVATRGCCHYQCAICIHTSQTLPKTNKERRSLPLNFRQVEGKQNALNKMMMTSKKMDSHCKVQIEPITVGNSNSNSSRNNNKRRFLFLSVQSDLFLVPALSS